MVQIWPGLMSPDLHTNSPGHIWTTLYIYRQWQHNWSIKRYGDQHWRTEGGWEGWNPPPPEIPNTLQNRAKLNPIWKLLKIAEFRTPTPQDVQKKSSKILKLPSVRNCFTLAMTNKLVVIINSLEVFNSYRASNSTDTHTHTHTHTPFGARILLTYLPHGAESFLGT